MKEIKIDKLCRIVIPKPLRKELSLTTDAPLSIRLDGESIMITPINRICALCGRLLTDTGGVKLCNGCINMIKKQ